MNKARSYTTAALTSFCMFLLFLSSLLFPALSWAQEVELPSPHEHVAVRNMFIAFAGSPGAGKTTQGTKLAERYRIPLVSVGNILRLEIASRTELGKKVAPYVEKGDLVPSDLLTALVKERLSRDDCRNGFILDGFPRRQEDIAAFLDILKGLKITNFRLLVLEVSPEVLVERLQYRRVCDKGHSYDLKLMPPKKEGICDIDGLPIHQRDDDKPETIRHRFEVYSRETVPVIDYFTAQGACTRVDGTGSIDAVFRRLIKILEPEVPKSNEP